MCKFFEDQNARENENEMKIFALFTNFWYRNFAQGDVHISFGGKIREVILNFFAKMLSGETLCKLLQIFPPKVLVYVWTNFSLHFFDYFMEIYLTN